jgi:K(+)-stimulated pyrophosphate-energized sodium pump
VDTLIYIPLAAGILAMLFVIYLTMDVLKKSQGSDTMADISTAVQLGAKAFLKREYTYISIFIVLIGGLLVGLGVVSPDLGLDYRTAISFVVGAVCSALAGYIGMSIATRSNARTAHAAEASGLKAALSVAVSGGGVMGMSVVGLSLIGLSLMFIMFYDPADAIQSSGIINGFAMGASLVALFARSGGGIFTKGADMGADLVGKVESNLPEDDPRNPAVIADNVGDNVGDVAGLGSDLMESYVESIIASVAIASTIGLAMGGEAGAQVAHALTYMPLTIASLGIVCSMVGIFATKALGKSNPQAALMNGTYVAGILTIVGSYFIVDNMGAAYTESGNEYAKLGPFYATLLGVVSGGLIGFMSEYYTSSKFKPVKIIAENSQSGPAITVTEGIAAGMASTAFPLLILAFAVIFSYGVAGVYGVGMAALGMLATTGMVVAVDSYGPIADNAGGIAEMAHLDPEVREITDNLDSVGNTTAAIGKGFAIGSAAFAALGLVVAFTKASGIEPAKVAITDVHVLAGLLIGAMLPYIFSAWLFRAVSNSAFQMIEEVRRQFNEIEGLREGKEGVKPDYEQCVDIATKGAIGGMMLPGIVAITSPLAMGWLMGVEALAGMLIGSLASGVLLGIFCANSGGAMDNAKKYVEEGNFGGKNSDTHKATVIGDTVGDPLKDTVGPSINILIKLMAIISLVLVPLFQKLTPIF